MARPKIDAWITEDIRDQIVRRGPSRLWRRDDFPEFETDAVFKAFKALVNDGVLKRVRYGRYESRAPKQPDKGA